MRFRGAAGPERLAATQKGGEPIALRPYFHIRKGKLLGWWDFRDVLQDDQIGKTEQVFASDKRLEFQSSDLMQKSLFRLNRADDVRGATST